MYAAGLPLCPDFAGRPESALFCPAFHYCFVQCIRCLLEGGTIAVFAIFETPAPNSNTTLQYQVLEKEQTHMPNSSTKL